MTVTKKTKHIPYIETAKQLAASQWGRPYESDEDAQREMLKDITLEGACLLGIIRRIDRFISSMTDYEVAGRISRLKDKTREVMANWLSQREPDHGKCPQAVLDYMWESAMTSIGNRILDYGDLRERWYPTLPPPNTEARREYDKWMKRKIHKSLDTTTQDGVK